MAKDKFSDLSLEEQDTIASKSPEELLDFVAKVALDNEALLKARDEDQDLAEKKEAVKEASAIYREGNKVNRLRIAFADRCLQDKGGNFVAAIKQKVKEARILSNDDFDEMN